MTRINNSNINGLSAVVERKSGAHVYPQIGHFFCNIPERKGSFSPDGDKDKNPLLIDLYERGHHLVNNLRTQNLHPQPCYRDSEPINLYHKVGHGTLDMYVLSPSKDAKEIKEFLQKWNTNDPKLFTPKDTKEFVFPVQNLVSICALLVWLPANPEDSITRILFPGSTPDFKILEGLDKIKHLEFMKHPICTTKTITPSLSTSTITKKSIKSAINDKSGPDLILPSKQHIKQPEKDNKIIDNKLKTAIDNKKISDVQSDSSSIEETKIEKQTIVKKSEIIKQTISPKEEKEQKLDNKIFENEKVDSISKDDEKKDETDGTEGTELKQELDKKEEEKATDEPDAKIETESKVIKTDDTEPKSITIQSKSSKPEIKGKTRTDTKAPIRSRIDSKPPKSMDKRVPTKKETTDKKEPSKPSPTATPKKTTTTVSSTTSTIKERETKSKVITRTIRSSPSSTPAKSAKDANNRKVLESKQKAVPKKETSKPADKKEPPKVERKPISRRPKTESPSRRQVGSPAKTTRPARTKAEKDKKKLDKDGTTDSSLVSTPSADDPTLLKKIVGAVEATVPQTDEIVDDSKEEQECIQEIEAVFKRDAEKTSKTEIKIDHREVVEISKQDSTTEVEEDEEYLIIEKEEVEQYTEDSINEQESITKEEEIQKHQRDSEESEKKRKKSVEDTEEVSVKDVGKVDDQKTKEIDKPDKKHELEKPSDIQPDSIEDDKIPLKEQIKEEVQEIITSAKEIAKTRAESRDELHIKTDEISSPSPEDKISSAKKTSDTKDDVHEELVKELGQTEPNMQESHPEEKFSATIESGATTAPTLPEDERIPLDEIREDLAVEEKYVKEETKENEIPVVIPPKVFEPIERVIPNQIKFDAQQSHLRDIVKTPDEVADLPVHEEVDYVGFDEFTAKKETITETIRKTTEIKEEKKVEEVKTVTKTAPTASFDKKPVDEVVEKIEAKVVDKVEGISTKFDKPREPVPQSDDDILKHIESQIILDSHKDNVEEVKSKKAEIRKVESPVVPSDELAQKVAEHDFIVPTHVTKPFEPEPTTHVFLTKAPSESKDEVAATIDMSKIEDIKDSVSQLKKTEDKLNEIKSSIEFLIEKSEEIEEKVEQTTKQIKEDVIHKEEHIEKTIEQKINEIDAKLQDEIKKIDDKLSEGVESIEKHTDELKKEIEHIDTKIVDSVQEIDTKLQETKESIKSVEETKEVTEEIVKETVEEVKEKTSTGISSFFDGIKTGIDKIAEKIEEKVETVESKLSEITTKTDKILKGSDEKPKSPLPEKSFDGYEFPKKISPPYDIKTFPTELRETHITTLDSPIKEGDRIDSQIKTLEKLPEQTEEEHEDNEEQPKSKMTFIIEDIKYTSSFEREDSSLNDIKEEEEEDRMSPPTTKPQDDTKQHLGDEKLEPPRPVSPRERTPEDVIKIVTNVAEVLKSDKDLEEIIPDFDPEELEKKLSARASPVRLHDEPLIDEDAHTQTVQRMLVTASSEDGGGEIEICPAGSIKFESSVPATPDVRSGRHTPELDTEINEFDKVEINTEKLVEVVNQETFIEKTQTTIVETEKIVQETTETKEIFESEDKHDLSLESSTSIKSIPDDSKEPLSPPSSGKSTPDMKTSPISIDEKEKHELPEKFQKDMVLREEEPKQIPTITSTPPEIHTQPPVTDRKESVVSDEIGDSRRESAISSVSEKDYTKEESSLIIDDREIPSHASDKSIEDIKDEVKHTIVEKDEVDVLDSIDNKFEKTPKEPTAPITTDVDVHLKEIEAISEKLAEPERKGTPDKPSHKLEEDYGIDEVDKQTISQAKPSESPSEF